VQGSHKCTVYSANVTDYLTSRGYQSSGNAELFDMTQGSAGVTHESHGAKPKFRANNQTWLSLLCISSVGFSRTSDKSSNSSDIGMLICTNKTLHAITEHLLQ